MIWISRGIMTFVLVAVLALTLLTTAPVVAQDAGTTHAAVTTQNQQNDGNDFPWGLLGLLGLGGLAGLRRREHAHDGQTVNHR